MNGTNELWREPEDSDYRFVVVFKDMHRLKQWDITQQVVINDDVSYVRYLIGTFPGPMKEYLIAFVKLFLRALESEALK
jgi:starvation-inducible outer membrane lipoprotein